MSRESDTGFRSRFFPLAVACWISLGVLALAVYGWASHWNAYTNLSLTLGDVVLWTVLVVAVLTDEPPGSSPKEGVG